MDSLASDHSHINYWVALEWGVGRNKECAIISSPEKKKTPFYRGKLVIVSGWWGVLRRLLSVFYSALKRQSSLEALFSVAIIVLSLVKFKNNPSSCDAKAFFIFFFLPLLRYLCKWVNSVPSLSSCFQLPVTSSGNQLKSAIVVPFLQYRVY